MAEFAFHSEEAQAFLKKLLKNKDSITTGAKSYATAISAIVFSDIISHFQEQKGSEGPWKAWSSAYAAHMNKIGKSGNQILQDTGRLRQSFTPTSFRQVNEGILWFNPAKTAKGFPYAAAHDEGGPNLPKRDFMWLSDDAKGRLEEVTLKFLEDVE